MGARLQPFRWEAAASWGGATPPVSERRRAQAQARWSAPRVVLGLRPVEDLLAEKEVSAPDATAGDLPLARCLIDARLCSPRRAATSAAVIGVSGCLLGVGSGSQFERKQTVITHMTHTPATPADATLLPVEVLATSEILSVVDATRSATPAPVALDSALAHAAPHLRHLLGQKIDMKFTPALIFRDDDSFSEARRIDELLASPKVARDLHHDD